MISLATLVADDDGDEQFKEVDDDVCICKTYKRTSAQRLMHDNGASNAIEKFTCFNEFACSNLRPIK